MEISVKKKLQLDHDFKRLAKGIRILMNESKVKSRELIGSLLFDEVERLREDVNELLGNGIHQVEEVIDQTDEKVEEVKEGD